MCLLLVKFNKFVRLFLKWIFYLVIISGLFIWLLKLWVTIDWEEVLWVEFEDKFS